MKARIVLIIIAAAAVISAIGVAVFLIYTLTLRTDYKETALQINDVILANQGQAVFQPANKKSRLK